MNTVVIIGLLIAGAIHLLPLAGLTGVGAVQRMYDVRIDDPNLGVLMIHRAALFGLLGGFLILAAFDRDLRWPAIVGGLGSAVSFLIIAWATGNLSAALRKVAVIDVVAVVALIAAAVAQSQL